MPVTEEDTSSKCEETPGTPSPTSHSNLHVNSPNSNIRRYLVLLQDCLAIKFVSIAQLHQKRIQQESIVKSHSNFPIPSSSTGCCHCLCSDDVGIVSGGNNIHSSGSRRPTVASSITNNACDSCNNGSNNRTSSSNSCSNKGRKCDCKSNNHKAASNVGSNDRGDHQECQFYRHQANQMSYPHHEDSSQSSSVKGRNSNGNDSGIIPTGDEVNHQTQLLINNKSNKSEPSANNNKGDYDDVGNGKQCCGCSSTEWESVQQRHQQMDSFLKRQQQQQGPAHHYDYLPQPNNYQSHPKGTSTLKDATAYSGNNNICRSTKLGQQERGASSMLNKVDHSMQALFLYKEFLEINLQCFWNSALHEAFKNLQYKGSVVPSTIIVGSNIRKHLTVLKTAWSRKMLKSPSGYIIDFLGEIEELIADPIAKSHFVPLSDSLCWAIHELTSSGQEAFVDDIFLSLASAFPGMALPRKELIYQTLEKLTRERKIYQTAQGYFVVTPETHRYIMSTEPLLIQASRADSQTNAEVANFLRNSIIEKASTLPPKMSSMPQRAESPDVDNRDENDLPDSRNESSSPDPDTYSLPYGTFKRYNSLRIRKQDKSGTTGCLPRRTLSMRLPKSKSKSGIKGLGCSTPTSDQLCKRADVTGSFQNLDSSQPSTVNEQLLSRRRKHKSFLSRLLSFRGVRKNSSRKDKSGRGNNANKAQTNVRDDKTSKPLISSDDSDCTTEENVTKNKTSSGRKTSDRASNLMTISTQTSFSIENLNSDLGLLSLAPASKSSTLEREDSDSGRCTDSHSDADAEITAALNRGLTPTIHGGRRRDCGSHSSCNVYEKIESDLGLKVDIDECDGRSPRSPSSQMSVSPSPSTFTTASNMCRGNHRHNLYSRCHSSASSTGYSYRDFYNLYRRRYPSYQQSTPTSLESAELNEGLKFKLQQPIRYPPRTFERKQIFDEINRSSFKDKKPRKTVSISNNVSSIDNGKVSRAGQHDSTECIVNIHNNDNNNSIQTSVNGTASSSSSSTVATTTFTQTLKNSTNLELEFRLPFGRILSAAMGGGNAASTMKKASSTDKLSSERSQQNESSIKSEIEETERTLSEVNTMVNDLFTIKSFVKTNPLNDELSSTIEFKTRGSYGKLHNNSCSKPNYVIETVSSKPFGDIHTKFHRESEII
ncbi:unnamed protein product [Orchesella dallaii]|uniref:Winged helix Storkhead-box1 domain-containing protein n=1 Tax=Orchesella dallaii TaxID=48710 RepID=A0ABP1R1A1_9HEXA